MYPPGSFLTQGSVLWHHNISWEQTLQLPEQKPVSPTWLEAVEVASPQVLVPSRGVPMHPTYPLHDGEGYAHASSKQRKTPTQDNIKLKHGGTLGNLTQNKNQKPNQRYINHV